ncbi:MFS transporter [Aminirod propionatiphilus]|uniref:MFS transporter n=1 Tax=Aminirod propionatiphilus TaxID=3415223 RepID=A0ACD1DVL3_9BACT|nr:MFS transporter [Synergistota bacterium]
MTHEGARTMTGPFLGSLGAGAALIGAVAGFGEFVGYALRLLSGPISDRTGRYWLVTSVGYALNLLAVPLLALAGSWPVAALLIVLERAGRAVRNPARDAMLSHATAEMGRGVGFGLHEACDQVGAVIGPLLIARVLFEGAGYRRGFALLLLPALAAFLFLGLAHRRFPRPETFEAATETLGRAREFPRRFWIYLAGASLASAGFVDYPLIAFHLGRTGALSLSHVALLYAMAMTVDAAAALAFGVGYDRKGIPILAVSTLISAFFAPLVFLGRSGFVAAGLALWAVGMGAQESVMRAAVGDLAPREKRATAYGLFSICYGLSWFGGSLLFGVLYERSIAMAVALSVGCQLAAVPFLLLCRGKKTGGNPPGRGEGMLSCS